jgi:hypothetical protein
MSFVISPSSSYGQDVPRITLEETKELLKKEPTLSRGFKTPENMKVRVLAPVRGGVVMEFDSDKFTGTITVLGSPTVMTKNFLGKVADVVNKLGGKLLDAVTGGGGGGTGTTTGNSCSNINVTGNNNNITVNGGICSKP